MIYRDYAWCPVNGQPTTGFTVYGPGDKCRWNGEDYTLGGAYIEVFANVGTDRERIDVTEITKGAYTELVKNWSVGHTPGRLTNKVAYEIRANTNVESASWGDARDVRRLLAKAKKHGISLGHMLATCLGVAYPVSLEDKYVFNRNP